MRWWTERQARKRREKLAGKWDNLRRLAKERIARREGRKFMSILLGHSLQSGYNYQLTQSYFRWRNGADDAIGWVIGRSWRDMDYGTKNALIDEVLTAVFKGGGADWKNPSGRLGLGLEFSRWVSIGVSTKKLVKDRGLILKLSR
jgi:hypothetical protein